MVAVINMVSSDYFVLRALRDLGQQRVTHKQIAEACEISCTERTVQRALCRLTTNEKVKRLSRSKAGCVYQVVEKQDAQSV